VRERLNGRPSIPDEGLNIVIWRKLTSLEDHQVQIATDGIQNARLSVNHARVAFVGSPEAIWIPQS